MPSVDVQRQIQLTLPSINEEGMLKTIRSDKSQCGSRLIPLYYSPLHHTLEMTVLHAP